MRAAALYLGGYQMIPYQRLAETFDELFACPLSQGTLANILRRSGRNSAVAMGKRHWLHVLSTEFLTCFHLDAQRSAEAMARGGIIPGYRGNLIHDCLGAYGVFLHCLHDYCNAHLQNELTYLHEEMKQAWAKDMIDLLLEAKELSDKEKARPPGARRVIGEGTVNRIMARYSGMFRSEAQGMAFCELRGVVSSVREQGRAMLESLKQLILSPAKLGESLATSKAT